MVWAKVWAEWRFLHKLLNDMEIKILNVRVTDAGTPWWGGPRSARVPPDRTSLEGSEVGVTAAGAEAVRRRPGGHPFMQVTPRWLARIGGLCDGFGGFDHRGCKSLIRRRLGGFCHKEVECSSTATRRSVLQHHPSD